MRALRKARAALLIDPVTGRPFERLLCRAVVAINLAVLFALPAIGLLIMGSGR